MGEIVLSDWIISLVHICVVVVFSIGLLCFFLRKRFIRQLVGLKLMLQSVSLGLLFTGWQNSDMFLSQSMVISALVIEAVIIGLALTMIIHIAKHSEEKELITEQKSLDYVEE